MAAGAVLIGVVKDFNANIVCALKPRLAPNNDPFADPNNAPDAGESDSDRHMVQIEKGKGLVLEGDLGDAKTWKVNT